MLSDAEAVIVTVERLDTLLPLEGLVIVTEGGVASAVDTTYVALLEPTNELFVLFVAVTEKS